MGSKAVLCLVVALVVGITAVVEKTREDHDQRRYVFSRNRTDTRHNTDKKHPISHSPVKHRVVSNVSHFHEATQFQNPMRKLNRRLDYKENPTVRFNLDILDPTLLLLLLLLLLNVC